MCMLSRKLQCDIFTWLFIYLLIARSMSFLALLRSSGYANGVIKRIRNRSNGRKLVGVRNETTTTNFQPLVLEPVGIGYWLRVNDRHSVSRQRWAVLILRHKISEEKNINVFLNVRKSLNHEVSMMYIVENSNESKNKLRILISINQLQDCEREIFRSHS